MKGTTAAAAARRTPPPRPFPAAPTRMEAIGVTCRSMNTCPDVVTKQWGTIPYFPPILGTLTDRESRQNCYNVARAIGDTHVILGFSSVGGVMYDEPCDIQHVIEPNQEAQPLVFRGLIEEARQEGFIPLIPLDGDNGDSPVRGHDNAMRQLPILADLLRSSPHADLTKHVVIGRMWDGVFYGTSREHGRDFGQLFRSILPDGYLLIEHQSGRIPWGEGSADWQPGAVMSLYDGVLAEIDYANDVPPNPTIWQPGGRELGRVALGGTYVIAPDQDGDFEAPFYLVAGTPRGRWVSIVFEWEGTFYAVRRGTNPGRSTPELEAGRRRYLIERGWQYTG